MVAFADLDPYPMEQLLAGSEPIALDTETAGRTRATNFPIYFSWASRDLGVGAGPVLTRRGLDFLEAICTCERPKIFHNAKFDLNVLETFLGLTVPLELVHDTILMHMLLDEHHLEHHKLKVLSRELLNRPRLDELILRKAQKRVGWNNLLVPQPLLHKYAGCDAEDTLDLYYLFEPLLRELGLWDLYIHEVEVEMVYKTIDRNGIVLDTDATEECITEVTRTLGTIREDIYKAFGERFKVSSRMQLGNVLKKHFPLTKKTKTGRWVTQHEVLVRWREDLKMQPVLAHNFLFKARSTLEGYRKRVAKDGRLHPDYRQTTVTGRSKCSNPNLENIPHNRGRLSAVEVGSAELAVKCADAYQRTRRSFTVPYGAALVSIDYSQVEFRCFAQYSGSARLIEGLCKGLDPHSMTSEFIWGVHDDRKRYLTKVVTYGRIYGMGRQLLALQLRQEGEDPRGFAARYDEHFPEMRQTQELVKMVGRKRGYVVDVFGRRYRLIPERPHALIAHLCQGTAANIKKYGMSRVQRLLEGKRSFIICDIHDELVFELYYEDRYLVRLLKAAMENFPQFDMPIPTKVEIGPNLLDTKGVTLEEIEKWDDSFICKAVA